MPVPVREPEPVPANVPEPTPTEAPAPTTTPALQPPAETPAEAPAPSPAVPPAPEPAPKPSPEPPAPAPAAPKTDDLAHLDCEFDRVADLRGWKCLWDEEKRDGSPVEKLAVEGGQLVLVPRTAVWFAGYRGPFVYREVKGDFAVTARVRVSDRAGKGVPKSPHNVAGILVRFPKDVSARETKHAPESYVFHAIGAVAAGGPFVFETKVTREGETRMGSDPAGSGDAILQVVRIRGSLWLLEKLQGQGWHVLKRVPPNDLPETLQVGFATCADSATATQMSAAEHNRKAILGGRPDLLARVDWVRFRTPKPPADYGSLDLAQPWNIDEPKLLTFLGEPLAK